MRAMAFKIADAYTDMAGPSICHHTRANHALAIRLASHRLFEKCGDRLPAVEQEAVPLDDARRVLPHVAPVVGRPVAARAERLVEKRRPVRKESTVKPC